MRGMPRDLRRLRSTLLRRRKLSTISCQLSITPAAIAKWRRGLWLTALLCEPELAAERPSVAEYRRERAR